VRFACYNSCSAASACLWAFPYGLDDSVLTIQFIVVPGRTNPIAISCRGIEFIDENGGGPGDRTRSVRELGDA
jgi:hypothetical protein